MISPHAIYAILSDSGVRQHEAFLCPLRSAQPPYVGSVPLSDDAGPWVHADKNCCSDPAHRRSLYCRDRLSERMVEFGGKRMLVC